MASGSYAKAKDHTRKLLEAILLIQKLLYITYIINITNVRQMHSELSIPADSGISYEHTSRISYYAHTKPCSDQV